MRRMAVMLSVMVFSFFVFSAAMAENIDVKVKVKGEWEFSFGWVNGTSFSGVHGNSTMRHGGGYTIDRNFITPEMLDGEVRFEIGESEGKDKGNTD